jgi:adenylate kinase
MFREAAASGTAFGRKAKEFMTRGELVPDDVVIGVVAERLAREDAVDHGFILDGFPRTRMQAQELQRILGPDGLDAAVDIDVPTDVVVERISGRRVCKTCGATYHVNAPPQVDWTCDKDGGEVVQREDDTPEAVKRRLDLYEKNTRPLLDFYDGLGLLVTVDGDGAPDEVFNRILSAVEQARQLRLSAR